MTTFLSAISNYFRQNLPDPFKRETYSKYGQHIFYATAVAGTAIYGWPVIATAIAAASGYYAWGKVWNRSPGATNRGARKSDGSEIVAEVVSAEEDEEAGQIQAVSSSAHLEEDFQSLPEQARDLEQPRLETHPPIQPEPPQIQPEPPAPSGIASVNDLKATYLAKAEAQGQDIVQTTILKKVFDKITADQECEEMGHNIQWLSAKIKTYTPQVRKSKKILALRFKRWIGCLTSPSQAPQS